MTRREMIKVATLTALATVTASAYDEKLILNKEDMKPQDANKMTKGELKHTPEITIGKKDKAGYTVIEVNVGKEEIIHPSTENHWIYEIELYADGKQVALVSLEPIISRGYLETRIKLDDVKELSAVAKCTLHGNWTSVKKV